MSKRSATVLASGLAAAAGLSLLAPVARATEFPANPSRFDPYKNFKFLVFLGTSTTPVPGVTRVSPLIRRTMVIHYNTNDDIPVGERSTGPSKYDEITLERGVTQDTTFEAWADAAENIDQGVPSMSLANLRKEVRLQLQNEAGQVVKAYLLHRCWVAQYQALSQLDMNAPSVATERVTLQCDSWERDRLVTEPKEF